MIKKEKNYLDFFKKVGKYKLFLKRCQILTSMIDLH